ncbi:MAG: DNA polymerase III subunit beta, partial [Muribaculaceae bacterium]|nr:DNA polymerase III subunit beta [Muribaculaceae bacterium]
MKFNVPGKDFAAKLQAVGKVVNAKNTLSIYDNFLLSLKGDRLFITGSDQENFLTASLEVFDADEDFSIAVNVKSVLEMTKEITSQPLTFEVNPQSLAVKLSFPSGQFDFPAIDGAEYPKRREDELEKTSFSLSADTVK